MKTINREPPIAKTDQLLAIAIIRAVRQVSIDLRTMGFDTWADKLDGAVHDAGMSVSYGPLTTCDHPCEQYFDIGSCPCTEGEEPPLNTARKMVADLTKALNEEHRTDGGHFDCDVCSMIAESLGIQNQWKFPQCSICRDYHPNDNRHPCE